MLSFVIKMSYLEMCLMVEPFRLPYPFHILGHYAGPDSLN